MEHLEYDSKLYENVIKCLAQSNHHEIITPSIIRKKSLWLKPGPAGRASLTKTRPGPAKTEKENFI